MKISLYLAVTRFIRMNKIKQKSWL